MRTPSLVALCVVVVLAGCASPLGSQSTPQNASPTERPAETHSPTPTATPSLPSDIDPSKVRTVGSLSTGAREAVARARNASQWVVVDSAVVSELNGTGYLYTDGRVWEYRIRPGTEMVDAEPDNGTTENGTRYETLTDSQQELFKKAVNRSDPYVIGPDETFVELPAAIEYQNRTYSLSVGTKSLGAGLDVDPYSP
jgi:hypothetical protein